MEIQYSNDRADRKIDITFSLQLNTSSYSRLGQARIFFFNFILDSDGQLSTMKHKSTKNTVHLECARVLQ